MNCKVILDLKTYNYKNCRNFLDITKKLFKEQKLVVYGGVAIHYALLLKGHPGLYHKDSLFDFDVLSNDYYEDSNELALAMYNLGYNGVVSIPAIHIFTRTIKLDFVNLCDITHIGIPLEDLPILKYKNLLIIHPLFQRITMYIPLSMPFAFERYENLLHRFSKDCERLQLLDEYYPIEVDIDNEVEYKEIKVTVDTERYLSGLVAYALYYKIHNKDDILKITLNNGILKVPKEILFTYVTYYDYTSKYKSSYKKRYRFKDYLPKAYIGINNNDTMEEIINIKNTIQCIWKIKHENKEYMVLNIYNLLLYFLCYYFLTIRNKNSNIYLQIVKSLQIMTQNSNTEVFGFSYNAVGDIYNNNVLSNVYRKKIDSGKIKNDLLPQYIPSINIDYEDIDVDQLKYLKENIYSLL